MSVIRTGCIIDNCERLQKSDGRKKSGVQKYKTICGYHYNMKRKERKIEKMKEKYGHEYAEAILSSLAQEVEKKKKELIPEKECGYWETGNYDDTFRMGKEYGYNNAIDQVSQLIRERGNRG